MTADDIWRCPHCRGALQSRSERLRCVDCRRDYECVDGIPDLRTPGDRGGHFVEDLRLARALAATGSDPLESLVRRVVESHLRDDYRVSRAARRILEGPTRLHGEVAGWLGEAIQPGRLPLDLGCGSGMLLAAAAARGCDGVGIDLSLAWLVVAKRLIAAHGGTPRLAAARAEALPLADASVDAVVSLDVIEHVRDAAAYLAEIDRVTRPGGRLALSTPNRFSLTPEPHVFVWGVGWLPRRWQPAWVRWRSGRPYDGTRLLGSVGLRRLLRRHTGFACRVIVPPVAPEEIAHFPRGKARLAEWYNVASRWPAFRWFFLLCGPFFRVTGVKPERATEAGPSPRPPARRTG